MVDRYFDEPHLAALYDPSQGCQDRDDFQFYHPLVMAARSVLDVGCGTGSLLRWARDSGHRGRLVGLDPAVGMLQIARRRDDVEWVDGDLATTSWNREFDLAIMTGHAFQVLLSDADLLTALRAAVGALKPDGRFVFETRNPGARAWERWTPENGSNFVAEDGAAMRSEHRVHEPREADLVTFTTTFSSDRWDTPETSTSTLRFLSLENLNRLLDSAGLAVVEQFGDWDRSPVTETSPEIITVTTPA